MPEVDAPQQADVQIVTCILPCDHPYLARFYDLLTLINPTDRPDLPILYMPEPQPTRQRHYGHCIDNRHKHGPSIMLHSDVTGAMVHPSVIIMEGHTVNQHKMLDDVSAVFLAEMELVGLEDVDREV